MMPPYIGLCKGFDRNRITGRFFGNFGMVVASFVRNKLFPTVVRVVFTPLGEGPG